MSNINRRSFLKSGLLLTAGSAAGINMLSGILPGNNIFAADKTDLAVCTGDNYFLSTIKAVEALGGITRFVSKGAKVGIVINSRYNKPGTYVKPEIALAAIKMCLDAGVKEVISLERVQNNYWNLSSDSQKYKSVISSIKQPDEGFIKTKIPEAFVLKEAEVIKCFLHCDVILNIPIFKQHEGIKITGTLKNYMGFTSQDTNRFFHFGNGAEKSDWYADAVFLSQCIADINLVRKSDLCIADATEFITTNGPFGPGNVTKLKKVAAGSDRVAVDSYGAKLLGYKPEEIEPIKWAFKHKLGEQDLKKVKIKEINV